MQAQNPRLGLVYNTTRNRNIDSLRQVLTETTIDSLRVDVLIEIAWVYLFQQKRDSAFVNAQQAFDLANKIKYLRGEFGARTQLATVFKDAGDYSKALNLALQNLKMAEQYNDTLRAYFMYRLLSFTYIESNDLQKVREYAQKNRQLIHSGFFKNEKDILLYSQLGYVNILAEAFERLNQLDSAIYYRRISYQNALSLGDNETLAIASGGFASILAKTKRYDEAFHVYLATMTYAKASRRYDFIADCHLGIAELFLQKNQFDSSLYYGHLAFEAFHRFQLPVYEMRAASFLNVLFVKRNQTDSAYKYLTIVSRFRDSLFNQEKLRQVQNISLNEFLREKQIEDAKEKARQEYETRLKFYGLIGGLIVLLSIAFILYRNSRQKQKANVLLREQKSKVESSLSQLKLTQSQLIQSEKMASLGELTAGIAHEIQNPLNFVNNFSDVNKELLTEMNTEIDKGNYDEVKTIAKDITENEEKINHHGKRADAIVRGMLQHSRAGSGQMEPTNINDLADEYLRLAFHGLRAKEKSFNTKFETDFDASNEKINVVPQDIGRVLLNLINNAFYAVSEKQNQNIPGYEPTIKVMTKKAGNKIEIAVADNGNGIRQKIQDKIFQPFFTTKPAGQGTGLGLSLAYDIVKAHGGEIVVNSREGTGSEFIVKLPVHENK